jgi:hypothetical protein
MHNLLFAITDSKKHLSHLLNKPKGWISEWITSGFVVNYEVLSAWNFYRWRGFV